MRHPVPAVLVAVAVAGVVAAAAEICAGGSCSRVVEEEDAYSPLLTVAKECVGEAVICAWSCRPCSYRILRSPTPNPLRTWTGHIYLMLANDLIHRVVPSAVTVGEDALIQSGHVCPRS